ncbi:MAG: hypothetical protein E3J25_11125 [Anaerolineales bacterium]|nr:MAG: hypothetical protein E3J25_11125 [Anaerolineales bacterium]
MYNEWYATEFFSQYEPFEDWVTGKAVQSTNVFDAWMLLVNLSSKDDAKITATFFYQDEPPNDFSFVLPAGRQGRVHMQEEPDNLGTANLPPGCNPRKRFGLRVRSDAPILVQATVGDRLADEWVTNSMATFMFHPGPLGELHTQWYYVDCVYLTAEGMALEEREWLTILNPNQSVANCTVTFIPGGDVDVGSGLAKLADKELAPVSHGLTVQPERILPTLISDWPDVLPNQPYAVQVRSDVPVTVQGIRHIFERGKYDSSRCWAVLDARPIAKIDE